MMGQVPRFLHSAVDRSRARGPEPPPALVIGLEGHRGAGKTAAAVYLAYAYYRAQRQQGHEARILTNVPLSIPGLPKDHVLLAQFDPEAGEGHDPVLTLIWETAHLARTAVLLDEAGIYLPSNRAAANAATAAAHAVAQVRKLHLWMIHTGISLQWVDWRILALTDIVGRCKDAALVSPGAGWRRGERTLIEWWDRSGIITGNPGTPIGTTLMETKKVWSWFKSEDLIDPRRVMAKVEVPRFTVAPLVEGDGPVVEAEAQVVEATEALEDTRRVWRG